MKWPASGTRWRTGALFVTAVACSSCAAPRTFEQAYLRSDDNWRFRATYRGADRLFNAFDYGHAILSETLLRRPDDAGSRLDGEQFSFITHSLLVSPPDVPLDEHAIAPVYAVALPEAIEVFEWAHALHRQLYDVVADLDLPPAEQDRRAQAALRYYRSRPDLALSARPKSMVLMEGQPYSLAFRRIAPRFNRLIWAYHWLQMALYDAMLDAPDQPARTAAVNAAVARFFVLVADSGDTPSVMPMSAAIAPAFTNRYPEAAIIFDNLHALHDVVSDILASPVVPSSRKRGEVLRALARFRDDTTLVTSLEEWRSMSRAMGADQMGGTLPVAAPLPRRP